MRDMLPAGIANPEKAPKLELKYAHLLRPFIRDEVRFGKMMGITDFVRLKPGEKHLNLSGSGLVAKFEGEMGNVVVTRQMRIRFLNGKGQSVPDRWARQSPVHRSRRGQNAAHTLGAPATPRQSRG